MSTIFHAPATCACCASLNQFSKQGFSINDDISSAIHNRIIASGSTAQAAGGGTVIVGTTFYGSLAPNEDYDLLSFSVTAGQTYSISLRGNGPQAVGDTLLGLYDSAGNLVNLDDDGGIGTNSLLTFTATTSGTYFIYADSFDNGTGGDFGDYRVDVRAESQTADVGDTFAGAQAISTNDLVFGFVGSQTGPYASFGDVDTYKITLQAGKYYSFRVAGGADYETDYQAVPNGELDTALILYDAAGNVVASNDDNNFPSDISSGVGFLATTSGTYYLDVTAYAGQRGGYTLQTQEVDIAGLDPVDSINWVSADNVPVTSGNVATVYFAVAGQNFGEKADDGTSPLVSYGWNDYEKGQVMAALAEYTTITGITYQVTDDASTATFRLITTTSEQYGAYFYPQDDSYGTQQGIGAFNVDSGGWSLPGQNSLQRGGYAFGVILHEFGHAHGLSHPHDNGGGSEVMLGVTGPDSLGIYDLNQGVYTVMSYNDAWERHPDGESPYTRDTVGFGWSGGLSAFDIAALQRRYGIHAAETGDNVYTLKDANAPGTYYEAIWDTGGTDEIRYDGAKNARIDLLAATLDYSPTGGGVVSFVDDIFGGYTIANGVVIENATGGAGNDVLLGNASANRLIGNAGRDTLMGRDGDDVLDGGLNEDALDAGAGNDRVVYDRADYSVLGGEGFDTLLLRTGETVILNNSQSSQIAGKQVFGFEAVDASQAVSGVTLLGAVYDNILIGSQLNDIIDGAGGRDTIDGRGGNDRIVYDAADYSILGGDGFDTLVVRSGETVVLANSQSSQVAGKQVYGFEAVDASTATASVILRGSIYDNILTGGSGNDIIDAGAGRDTVDGRGGNDRIVYDAADYSILGGDGIDTLVLRGAATVNLANTSTSQIAGGQVFGFENVDASGSTAPVTLIGSSAANLLTGGAGADTLRGGGGGDTLFGGAGNDRFMFDNLSSASNGRTRIGDFAVGDKIDLSGIDAVSGGADNAFKFIGQDAFHNVAGELRYVAGDGGQIVQGDVNGDGVSDFSILVNTGTIQESYFTL